MFTHVRAHTQFFPGIELPALDLGEISLQPVTDQVQKEPAFLKVPSP